MAEEINTMQEDEIDLIELVKTIWAKRRFIVKGTCVFIVLGLIIALTSPVEYTASCRLLPEDNEGSMSNIGGLGSLAGLAGIDLGSLSAGSTLSPELYPEIVYSLPFILDLMNDTIYFERLDLETTSFYYIKELEERSIIGGVLMYTIGLPYVIKGLFQSDQETILDNASESEYIRITKKDWRYIERFKKRVTIDLDEQTGVVSIWVDMQDAYAAAQLANSLKEKVTQAIIDYKTDKAQTNLEFVTQTFEDAKDEFQSLQMDLARLTDRNRNVTTSTGQIELTRVENQYNVAFEVYKGLASQVEQAKIKLKQDTPIFTVLEPIRIPEDKSSPKRGIMMIIFTFLGLILSVFVVILKTILNKLKFYDRI